jgi:hypothetical protein
LSRYRKERGRPEEVRHELASGDFARYYWETLVDGNLDKLSSLPVYNVLRGLGEETLEQIFLETLGALPMRRGRRINEPVFCSKLLHWTFPAAFPMMDKKALTAIREEAGKIGMHPVPEDLREPTDPRAYRVVLNFYTGLEEKLKPEEREQLEKDDFKGQPEGLKVDNSWVRVIDKWLWLRGKEINESNPVRNHA